MSDSNASTRNSIEFKVVSGRHAGVTQYLSHGFYNVGSSLDADIVITDQEVATSHFRLGLSYKTVQLEVLENPLRVNNTEISAGKTVKFRYPILVSIGNVSLECGPTKTDVWNKFAGFSNHGAVNRAVAVGAICTALIVSAASYTFLGGTASTGSNTLQAQGALSGTAARLPGTQNNSAEKVRNSTTIKAIDAAQAFHDRLVSLNLKTVMVSADSGMVVARGNIDPANTEAWRASQLWFDQSFGAQLMLKTEVAITAKKNETAPLSLQSIWAGPSPYVIDARGDKYFEGSLLANGWSIDRIERDKVTLRKASELLVIRL